MITEKENLSRTIINLIKTTNLDELLLIIKNSSINIWDLRYNDETIIHLLVINNLEKSFVDTIEEAKKRPDFTKERLKKWVNAKNKDGCSALLLASYRGNLLIIKKLIENQADYETVNSTGLGVLHLAAQGNQPNIIVYFKEKFNMDLNSADSIGTTVLHWSCYAGSNDVFDYLISYKVNLDFKDREGNTPLHLAVISERASLVKALLLHGANRNIKNSSSLTPRQLAELRNKRRIVDVFDEERDICGFKIWRIPLEKIEVDNKNIYLFMGFQLITQFIVLELIIPYFETDSQRTVTLYVSTLIFGLTMSIYLYLLVCDPGKMNSRNNSLLEIADQNLKMNDYCPTCVIKKTSHSRHCVICNFCVENFDHHCFWINNCVGAKNIGLFFIFLIVLEINLAFNVFLGFCGYYFASRILWEFSRFILFFCVLIVCCCTIAFVTILFLMLNFMNKSLKNKFKNINIDGAKEQLIKTSYHDNPVKNDIII